MWSAPLFSFAVCRLCRALALRGLVRVWRAGPTGIPRRCRGTRRLALFCLCVSCTPCIRRRVPLSFGACPSPLSPDAPSHHAHTHSLSIHVSCSRSLCPCSSLYSALHTVSATAAHLRHESLHEARLCRVAGVAREVHAGHLALQEGGRGALVLWSSCCMVGELGERSKRSATSDHPPPHGASFLPGRAS